MLTDVNLKGNESKVGEEPGQTQNLQSSGKSRTTALWVAFALLVAGLFGVTGYGYYLLKQSNIRIRQLPAAMKSVVALNARLNATEARLTSWASDWQELAGRVGSLEQKSAKNLRAANKHAERLTTELEGRLEEKMDGQAYIDNTRLNALESGQRAEHAQLARLEQELGSARRELAAVQQDLTAYRQAANQRLANLDSQTAGNSREIGSLSQRLDARRVDFELRKDHTHEVAQGISLKLTATDVARQKFGGWISLTPDGRTLWVERQGVQQPFVFYKPKDKERCELVVTRVAQDSATGYLLVAATGNTGNARDISELAPLLEIAR
ncbi:MAG TPA: hypothetical protein VFD30_16655 [Terriglobia bacterium]|jgi:vacuolar-type H+-ATPase subunit E/Vma4|nr:hypothetical protein [Terriglobia bacterium]